MTTKTYKYYWEDFPVGKVREFLGNLHIVMRAYAWAPTGFTDFAVRLR